MDASRSLLLTGATGLLGRFLLHDLLRQNHPCRVVVLVRPTTTQSARERIEAILDHWQLPGTFRRRVAVLEGILPDYYPDLADRRVLSACDTVLHAAASLNFRPTAGGEPRQTNVEGTHRLLNVTTASRWIQISTAYVAGHARGCVFEEDDPAVFPPRNYYEDSKRAAEQLVRRYCKGCWTLIRPGILIGDSQTGYTSNYQGIYWLFRAVAQLASRIRPGADGVRRLPLRLAMRGDERKHLVPVNWASQAIVHLLNHPASCGRAVHLVPREPVRVDLIRDTLQEAFGVEGMEFTGCKRMPPSSRNSFERLFNHDIALIEDYLCDDPSFDRRNLDELLPGYPSPVVNTPLIRRLIAFAEADNWGKRSSPAEAAPFACAEFFERHFPMSVRRCSRERITNLNAVVRFVIRGEGGGTWTCRLEKGDVAEMAVGSSTVADFEFVTETDTFREVVCRRISPREAFFARRIEIKGDIERALIMAQLFEDLLDEFPFREVVPQAVSEGEELVSETGQEVLHA